MNGAWMSGQKGVKHAHRSVTGIFLGRRTALGSLLQLKAYCSCEVQLLQ